MTRSITSSMANSLNHQRKKYSDYKITYKIKVIKCHTE